MPSYENATPIRVLHNSAGHLSGAARSLGGVVVGYLGVRVFTPQPVASMIHSVGGASLLLGILKKTFLSFKMYVMFNFKDIFDYFFKIKGKNRGKKRFGIN